MDRQPWRALRPACRRRRAPIRAADYPWRAGAGGYLDNSRFARIPGYGLLTLAAGVQFRHAARQWDISLWAKNALDQRYFLTAAAGQPTNGAYVAAVDTPRTVGVTARLEF